jgi:hypothetical protein
MSRASTANHTRSAASYRIRPAGEGTGQPPIDYSSGTSSRANLDDGLERSKPERATTDGPPARQLCASGRAATARFAGQPRQDPQPRTAGGDPVTQIPRQRPRSGA